MELAADPPKSDIHPYCAWGFSWSESSRRLGEGFPIFIYAYFLLTRPEYYGNVEAFCGIIKIGLVVTAFVVMIVINKSGACGKN